MRDFNSATCPCGVQRERLVLFDDRFRLRLQSRGSPTARLKKRYIASRFSLRVAVLGRADLQLHVVRRAEQRVNPLQPHVRLGRAAHVEVIPLLGQDDDRLGSHRRQEVTVIESHGEHSRRALFGIGGKLVFQVAAKRRDEAAGRAHRPAAFEAAQPRRHRAAAGVARDADVLRIDLLARQQIVESPNAVPGSPRAEELADQELLIAGV